MYYTYRECGLALQETGKNYSFAIRMREDVGLSHRLSVDAFTPLLKRNPKLVLATDCRHQYGINDRMALVGKDAAEAYFRGPYDLYEATSTKNVSGFTLAGSSEMFLHRAYTHYGLKVEATPDLRFVVKLQWNGTVQILAKDEGNLRCPGGAAHNGGLMEQMIGGLQAFGTLTP